MEPAGASAAEVTFRAAAETFVLVLYRRLPLTVATATGDLVIEGDGALTAVYGPEVLTAYRYYWENRLAEFRDIGSEAELTLDHLAHDRLILGEPETCIREFHRWQEATGADYFLLRLRHAHSGGPAHARIMDAIRLFGDRVLPYCR